MKREGNKKIWHEERMKTDRKKDDALKEVKEKDKEKAERKTRKKE